MDVQLCSCTVCPWHSFWNSLLILMKLCWQKLMYTTGICNWDSVCFPCDRNSVCNKQMHFRPAVDPGPNRGRPGSIRGRSLSSWYLALWLAFSRVCCIACQFHSTNAQCLISILPLPEGQAGEEWDPSNKAIHCFIYLHACSKPTNAHGQYMLWRILLIMYMFWWPLPPSWGRVGNLLTFC